VCKKCDFSQNTEICKLKEGDNCPNCGKSVKLVKSIEVGNIFKLGCKYSHDLGLTYVTEDGKTKEVVMGCYGIGPSRVMGAVVEICHDKAGIKWPKNLTPYDAHLLLLDNKKKAEAEKIYQQLTSSGWEILFDDRQESAGVKLNDADLIGISLRLIIGEKTDDKIEYQLRTDDKKGTVKKDEVIKLLEKVYK